MREKETFAVGENVLFQSPYEQYAQFNGEKCEIVRLIDQNDDDHDIDEVGLMLEIRFGDGTVIEAWPEELHDLDVA